MTGTPLFAIFTVLFVIGYAITVVAILVFSTFDATSAAVFVVVEHVHTLSRTSTFTGPALLTVTDTGSVVAIFIVSTLDPTPAAVLVATRQIFALAITLFFTVVTVRIPLAGDTIIHLADRVVGTVVVAITLRSTETAVVAAGGEKPHPGT